MDKRKHIRIKRGGAMKRTKYLLFLIIIILTGCTTEMKQNEIKALDQTIGSLMTEKHKLTNEIKALKDTKTDIRIEKNIADYYLIIQIKQSHYLDIGKMLKDEMNKVTIRIKTTKEFYDSVKVGQVLNDDFRGGSFFLEGSIGSWDIKVLDKEVE
mgnify:CR=1 FL=1